MLEYVYDNFTYFDEFLKRKLTSYSFSKRPREGLLSVGLIFRECGLDKDELEKTMLEKAGLWLDEGYTLWKSGEGFLKI